MRTKTCRCCLAATPRSTRIRNIIVCPECIRIATKHPRLFEDAVIEAAYILRTTPTNN